jgi:hypothetical protein
MDMTFYIYTACPELFVNHGMRKVARWWGQGIADKHGLKPKVSRYNG